MIDEFNNIKYFLILEDANLISRYFFSLSLKRENKQKLNLFFSYNLFVVWIVSESKTFGFVCLSVIFNVTIRAFLSNFVGFCLLVVKIPDVEITSLARRDQVCVLSPTLYK